MQNFVIKFNKCPIGFIRVSAVRVTSNLVIDVIHIEERTQQFAQKGSSGRGMKKLRRKQDAMTNFLTTKLDFRRRTSLAEIVRRRGESRVGEKLLCNSRFCDTSRERLVAIDYVCGISRLTTLHLENPSSVILLFFSSLFSLHSSNMFNARASRLNVSGLDP